MSQLAFVGHDVRGAPTDDSAPTNQDIAQWYSLPPLVGRASARADLSGDLPHQTVPLPNSRYGLAGLLQKPQHFELLIEALGGDGNSRAEFLREEGDLEFFDEPTEFLLQRADFRDARRLRGKARDDLGVGRELRGAFGVLLRIQRGAFNARQ